MKFSHSVQFNAVPEWSNHYINYSNLKKLIYTFEKAAHNAPSDRAEAEASPLISDEFNDDSDSAFQQALDSELEKICLFYKTKELEIYGELQDLSKDAENYVSEASNSADLDQSDLANSTSSIKAGRPRRNSLFQSLGLTGRPRRASTLSASIENQEDVDSDDDDNAETSVLQHKSQRRKTVDAGTWNGTDDMHSSRELRSSWTNQNFDDFSYQALAALNNSRITLKKRTISLYVNLCELKSFVQLNQTGFTKALKKYDKILDRNLKNRYLNNKVKKTEPFTDSTMAQLDENIQRVEMSYADVVTKGDATLARKELRLHLREHVVWERNTVWREMIGIERKAQAANVGVRQTLLGGSQDPAKARLQGDELEISELKEFSTPVGHYRLPKWLLSGAFFTLMGSIMVFALLLTLPIMDRPEQQNCFALLVFVSLLWATEVIPLFVTSLLVPFLAVILRVIQSEGEEPQRLPPTKAAKVVFAAMWTPVITLLLGGFTIAAALSKYHIAKLMATFVLSKAGTKPRVVLLTNMFVAMIASMWISNVAAPVLCYSLIQPLLRNLPADSDLAKALILGIAMASNIGGAASPIASPQNIIALQNMQPNPSWLVWFVVAIPICVISIVLIWIMLLVSFQPGRGPKIASIRPSRDSFSGVQLFISFVTVTTIVLWCFSRQLEDFFGDMGVIAIIPMALFFGTGILTKEDFNNFLWTIIILAAGGLSLGHAVSSSGLLQTVAESITQLVTGLNVYTVFAVFALLILVIATFISHTVAALIVLPLVQQVGANMTSPHPNLLVMGSALMCSAAMGLPTSGFPNMTAIMMEDPQTGRRYLQVKHFISRGIPASISTFIVIVTIGFALMWVLGL